MEAAGGRTFDDQMCLQDGPLSVWNENEKLQWQYCWVGLSTLNGRASTPRKSSNAKASTRPHIPREKEVSELIRALLEIFDESAEKLPRKGDYVKLQRLSTLVVNMGGSASSDTDLALSILASGLNNLSEVYKKCRGGFV